jgi:hypothetical protein
MMIYLKKNGMKFRTYNRRWNMTKDDLDKRLKDTWYPTRQDIQTLIDLAYVIGKQDGLKEARQIVKETK